MSPRAKRTDTPTLASRPPKNTYLASSEVDRSHLRGRIAVALDLALGNSHAEALQVLANIGPVIRAADNETVARYFHSSAVSYYKARLLDESFKAFERSLAAARATRNRRVIRVIAVNYGVVLVQDGAIGHALRLLEEALEGETGMPRACALMNLAEALFAVGDLQRAATILHQFHALHGGNPNSALLLAAAATGIPVGIMSPDRTLLRLSTDASLLELAFSRPRQQHLLGQVAEAFCLLYEHQGRRVEHDTLLERAVDSLPSLDSSVALAIRAARLGSAYQLPRVKALLSQHCVGDTALDRAHRALFDSFIASRHRMARRAKKLGLQALRDLAGIGRPFLEALALDASGLHAAARDLRRRCGASVDAMCLRWTGPPLRRGMATHLTARENEIALLAARGSTDRAIAARLGLSERTVQCHCRAILGKLGIHSRWQLARAPDGSAERG